MTTERFPELQALRVEVEPESRDRHLAAVEEAVRALGPVRARRRWVIEWRRWTAAAAAATVLIVPAAAIAADDALPGELLYPVKRFVEPVVQIISGDVVAEHRVEELERLVDSRPDAARDLLAEARDAVADAANPILADRLDAVVDSLRAAGDAAPADVETDRLDQDAVPTTTTDPAHSSGSGAPTDVRDGASATDGGDVSGERDDSDDDPVVADPAESDRPLHDDGTDDRLDPGTDTAEEDAPATTAAPTDADAIDGATGDRTAPNDTP